MSKENEELEKTVERTLGQKVKVMDENDTFGFHCVQCGQCCINRRDIILNPFDIYNGAKYLNISCQEFFEKYCYVDLGATSKIPMVLLDTANNGFCPLLKLDVKDGGKFKCTIHPAKPGACSNHPIGVCFGINKDNNTFTDITYIKTEQCPNSVSDEQHVIKDWVKPYTDHLSEIGVAHEIQHYLTTFYDPQMFMYMCKFFSEPILNDKENATDEEKHMLSVFADLMKVEIDATINIGYLLYKTDMPFEEQAREAMDKLKEVYDHLKDVYAHVKHLFEGSPDNLTIGDVKYDTFEELLKGVIEKGER